MQMQMDCSTRDPKTIVRPRSLLQAGIGMATLLAVSIAGATGAVSASKCDQEEQKAKLQCAKDNATKLVKKELTGDQFVKMCTEAGQEQKKNCEKDGPEGTPKSCTKRGEKAGVKCANDNRPRRDNNELTQAQYENMCIEAGKAEEKKCKEEAALAAKPRIHVVTGGPCNKDGPGPCYRVSGGTCEKWTRDGGPVMTPIGYTEYLPMSACPAELVCRYVKAAEPPLAKHYCPSEAAANPAPVPVPAPSPPQSQATPPPPQPSGSGTPLEIFIWEQYQKIPVIDRSMPPSLQPDAPQPKRLEPGHSPQGADGPRSTITMRSDYNQITDKDARAIMSKYKTIPGGIMLEGGAANLGAVRTAKYSATLNTLVLNDTILYPVPIPHEEFRDIVTAVAKDDRVGVSLLRSGIVMGKLPTASPVVANMYLADRFLGALSMGGISLGFVRGYQFAPGYRGTERLAIGTPLTVTFTVSECRFDVDDLGRLYRSDIRLASTLIPTILSPTESRPDYARIERGDVPQEFVANLQHIAENFPYYANERIVRTTFAYAEVAALARGLRNNGVKLEKLFD